MLISASMIVITTCRASGWEVSLHGRSLSVLLCQEHQFECRYGLAVLCNSFGDRLGANVKFIQRKIKDNLGSGTGFDIGVKIKTDMAILFDADELGALHMGFNFKI